MIVVVTRARLVASVITTGRRMLHGLGMPRLYGTDPAASALFDARVEVVVGSQSSSSLMNGRVSERLATSVKPAFTNIDARPIHAQLFA